MSSPSNIAWLREDVALAIHEAQIAEHGGEPGIRDRGLLQSALARPQQAAAYASSEIPVLAALYALGIIKNHPFVDGNKRVAAVLLELFLRENDRQLLVNDADLAVTILALASGNMRDTDFTAWVRKSCA